MIKRLFFSPSLLAVVCVSIQADEPIVKANLGIRDTQCLRIKKLSYPLAFRIENAGKTTIRGSDIAGIFEKGIVHLFAEDGNEQQYDLKKDGVALEFGIVPNDLQPGETVECKLVGDILTFFPSAKDGDYQVWWTLGDSKSNALHFTVASGKVLIPIFVWDCPFVDGGR